MVTTRTIEVAKPVKLIFAGGFLGSGKTTALGAIGKRLLARKMRIGIVTNDQSDNLADTVIVREMLEELGVPIEEVTAGCFCCKFEELIDNIEKILVHEPDILLGEPVGSCTDFVAAVANPIKIHYQHAFRFAPFTTMVDPDRVRELLLGEEESGFPEEVAYLFGKQLEEADVLVLNKVDLLASSERQRLVGELTKRYPAKEVFDISALDGDNVDSWLDFLLSGRPGANSVLSRIDYDRYARAEAVLGWLNAAVLVRGEQVFDAPALVLELLTELQRRFVAGHSEIGHLKAIFTSGGKSVWGNLTNLRGTPACSTTELDQVARGSLIVNARVHMEPARLEEEVRQAIAGVSSAMGITAEIDDLQCFSPAYPEPPNIVREIVEE